MTNRTVSSLTTHWMYKSVHQKMLAMLATNDIFMCVSEIRCLVETDRTKLEGMWTELVNSRYEKIKRQWIKINKIYTWKHTHEHNKKYLMNCNGKGRKNKQSCKQDSVVGRSRDHLFDIIVCFQSDLFIWHAIYPMPMWCGVCGGTVGWGTVLQAGRSQV